MRLSWPLWASIALLAVSGPAQAGDDVRQLALRFFSPLPATMPAAVLDTADQIALGQSLYFETALSANRTQSCNSCHNLLNGGAGVDGRPTSPGALGTPGRRNSPTTWNAGLQFAQFWDGRAASLEEQARSPILNAAEMALGSEQEAMQRLQALGYGARFDQAFSGDTQPFRFGNLLKALAAFQRTLISQDRFDEYLRGADGALSAAEQRGLERFIRTGCNGCHSGALLGGDSIMKLGTAHRYPNEEDGGRAEVTGESRHRFYFKVPPLRNVGLTAPYFHDGAVASLEQAVFGTAWHQLGVKLSDQDTADISAFLRAMNNTRQRDFALPAP